MFGIYLFIYIILKTGPIPNWTPWIRFYYTFYLYSGGNPARLFICSALKKSLKIGKKKYKRFERKIYKFFSSKNFQAEMEFVDEIYLFWGKGNVTELEQGCQKSL